MGYSIPLNFPPRDVISSQNKNFEHIILWMLNNNPECQWAAFKEEPLNISQSTLSIYLNRLQNNGFIDKARRGYYKITSKGREKFIELSRSTLKDRLLSFPPKVIMKKRNYDHWILWMVYNNTSCKWSDFTSAPLDINQSSLSKNLNMLMDNGLVRKENKEYIITQSGKLEYSQMLRNYDLDRQSILEAEGNRIRELTLITLEFFEKYNINDTGIKFRFLNNVLKLPYDRVKSMVNSSEDFTKILLFISTNHPNRYPKYISAEEFGRKYGIEKITLDYVIHRILTQTKEKPIYPIKFFNLTDNKGKTYYFQEGEKLERILNAIVDDIVNHSYYLHRLYQETDDENGKLSLSNIIEDCINEICHKLFHDDLRDALRVFLPNYLNYLRYQIEAKREFYDHLDKLEGITWQHIPESLQESLKKDKKQYINQ